jgi:peroxiredoxin
MTKLNQSRYLLACAILLLLISMKPATAQRVISGTIKDYDNKMITLFVVRGDMKVPVDSIRSNQEGHFTLITKNWYRPGMYMVQTADGNIMKLIYNLADIRFVSQASDENSEVVFIDSDENQLWYDYSILKSNVRARQELIKPVLQQYPKNELFYNQAVDAYNLLQMSLKQKVDSIYSKRSETLAARFIRTDAPTVIDLSQDFDTQRKHLKDLFFDDTDFADTMLISSDVLTSKMIDFLSLHQRPSMNMAELQLSFMQALDVILKKASVEKKMYLFVLDYFLEGFARMGFTGVTDYLSNLPHLDNDCMDMETLFEIERIAGPHRKIIVGSEAPDIAMDDIYGNAFALEKTKGKSKIVIFWSVTCPHCIGILPEVKKLSARFPELQVISFVISNDRKSMMEIIEKEKLSWTHLSDGAGWAGPITEAYMVYGTPTFFILDENNHILSKPSGIAEMEAVLTNHFDGKK